MDKQLLWWQSDVIYQIYPRSFRDSNADGIGDLPGILEKLDYLEWLGVDAIWLSPVYPSPMADFGYDISDYTGIHPIFGDMAQFDELLNDVHRRGMKLLLDFVPNHSSDQHPWFMESRSSRENPRRDWYMWYDKKEDGSVPNNWLSVFGGSAWEWDEHTQQYYYHGFLKEQPDLNWRNPELQNAMLGAMKFWLDKGVDGFRVDVVWHMIKDTLLRDNPPNPSYRDCQPTYDQLLPVNSTDQPEVHEIIRKMRGLVDQYDARVLIGEIYLPVPQLMLYYGENLGGAHLPFNFQLIDLPWNAREIANAISIYEKALPEGGWPNWVLGNHDRSRIASRVGKAQARIAGMLLLTLRGTPTMYYGDELGMKDVAIPREEIVDPQGLNMPDKDLSRDPFRTPMQWNGQSWAGFSECKPWLRVAADYDRCNVEVQQGQADSFLALYKALLRLRKTEPSLSSGNYHTVFASDQVLAFERKLHGHSAFLIILNLGNSPAAANLGKSWSGTIEISTTARKDGEFFNAQELILEADEGIVIKLKS